MTSSPVIGAAFVAAAMAGGALWTVQRQAAGNPPLAAASVLAAAGPTAPMPATSEPVRSHTVAADAGIDTAALPLLDRRGDGRLRIDLRDADRRSAIERLAALTGSRLSGFGLLPLDLGRVHLQSAAIDAPGAWQRLLDGVPASFAIACDEQSCQVSFAAAATPSAAPAGSTGSAAPENAARVWRPPVETGGESSEN